MKRVILIILALTICLSLCSCGKEYNYDTIPNFDEVKEKVIPKIDEAIKVLKSWDDVDFTIDNIVYQYGDKSLKTYVIYLSYYFNIPEEDVKVQREVLPMTVEKYCTKLGKLDDGFRLTINSCDSKDEIINSHGVSFVPEYLHISIFINGELIKSSLDYKKEAVSINDEALAFYNNVYNNPSSSAGKTCPICGRTFGKDDTTGNYTQILKSGMCSNCTNNYKSMKDYL